MNKQITRRDFAKYLGAGILGLGFSNYAFAQKELRLITPYNFTKLPFPEYKNIFHEDINWKKISEGMEFSRVKIFSSKKLVDIISAVKINPEKNKIEVFDSYTPESVFTADIEHWQKIINAKVLINSSQYQGGEYYYKPCALILGNQVSLTDSGNFNFSLKKIGSVNNSLVKGMFVSEPKNDSLPKADLLDFDYDSFDYKTTSYTQGVQHWPILLDRQDKIKVKKTLWQANRTVIAKDKQKNILFMTTEGGYFTLYNLGQFLRDSNKRQDKGFNIHTAMNLDGGYEAEMIVKTKNLEYLTYGKFETYGLKKDATVFNSKITIPGVMGVFPRD